MLWIYGVFLVCRVNRIIRLCNILLCLRLCISVKGMMLIVCDIYIVVLGMRIGGDFFSEVIIVFRELLCLCIRCSKWKRSFF